MKELWICLVTFSMLPFSWSFSKTHRNSVLPNCAIRNVTSVDWLKCIQTCAQEALCVSYNYYLIERVCELNSRGVEGKLLAAEGVVFQQIKPSNKHHIDRSPNDSILREICSCNCGSERQCDKKEESKFVKIGKGDLPNNTAVSCLEIYNLRGTVPSKAYYIRTTSWPKYRHVYCHMTTIPGCGGGGWTLALKIDGSKNTFSFNSSFWTNQVEMNKDNSKDLTAEETKTAVYWSTAFKKICLGMRYEGVTRWMLIPQEGVSVLELAKVEKRTDLAISSWKSLLQGALLRENCTWQGFNVQEGPAKARIGIIGFAGDTCSGDAYSVIGLGTSGDLSCGNSADVHRGPVSKKAFGFILVQ